MQTVDGRDRVVAYASKLLVGSEKNWIHKQDGTSEIECWGIVWATRKFRCYLDRQEFDLFTDHKALTWVFEAGNRTSNAKPARWAMELSQLRFKVFHKAGTAMGPVDGLSRLHYSTVNALTWADLLNAEEDDGEDRLVQVEEEDPVVFVPTTAEPRNDVSGNAEITPAPEEDDTEGEAGSPPTGSSLDEFGLDKFRFVEEQKRTPWIMAMVAFLEAGTLPLDAQLRVRVLQMAPHFGIRNGVLMRLVHLRARAGPARTISVPVIPLQFIETVLHYCHSDLFSAHAGLTKTVDSVRKHAYWHGWKKDAKEYVRACTTCGSGKGYRPWKNGLMQRMPVQELSGPFSLLVVDAIGPVVTTPRGNKYILNFVDYFTRWVEAFPVTVLDTLTFVQIMVDEVLSRHGVPERLLNDRGPNFISSLAQSFYQTLGIKKVFGAAYHPQTQGLVERFNGTLLGMLRMYVGEAQTDWDLYLPRVLFAYRTSYHEALGDSPFFSLYGRDPVLPLDLAFLNTNED
ncbi:hypothetical protein PR001_g15422 [Phytophthora rubi]|uniref:Integrase catalytic domain-containing protein n=2 Tax=Phytophthora rubi TaxID=129364 RepID=A0A6A3L3A5_9STRA|nr:hypothetical protein PR001_g15422 [Phytophthora rubi]